MQGYMFYLVIFYILAAILFISVAICIWVGWCFMNDNFPFLWPIKVARVVVSLFVSMFYIASLNIFLMACACKQDKYTGLWLHLVWGNSECTILAATLVCWHCMQNCKFFLKCRRTHTAPFCDSKACNRCSKQAAGAWQSVLV
jgi:hypothetical protein